MLCVSVLHLYSRVSKKYDASNRGPLDVKWRRLDFSLLLNSALKFLTVLADRGVYSADCHNENGRTADCQHEKSNLRADCHRSELSAWFSLGLSA
jgi:hypothetical protein